MKSSPLHRATLLAGAAIAAITASPLAAQQVEPEEQVEPEPSPAPNQERERETGFGSGSGEIVVSAARLRGSLDVEQAPLLELDQEAIAAEGVTSIADLITQITNQTGSARGRGSGGRPVILINGIRVSSFREFRNYPPEALERVEVFPEEVAQRFGFPPDARVINLILKDSYRNAEVELEFEGPARGGYFYNEQELGFLQIADGARINASLEFNDTSLFTENERDLVQTPGSVSDIADDPDQAAFRSFVADSRSIDGNVSLAKALIESGVSLSANATYSRNDSLSLSGLNTVRLTDPGGNSALRTFGADTPLTRRSSSDSFATSGSFNKPVGAFQLTSTVNGSLAESTQEIARRFDTSDLVADAAAGLLALDANLPTSADAGFDTAFSRTTSGNTFNTLRGPIAQLPGGELLATFDAGYNWTRLESEDTRTDRPIDLTRGDLSTGMNLVVPITSRRNGFADALGSFALNGQIGLNHLSDFGTLGDYTIGLTWAPFDNLDLSATYIMREVAPGLSALGGPQVENLNVPVFDFTTGETTLVTFISGSNPDLLAETQRDWKLAANWGLPFWDGARLTIEYIRNRSDDVTRGFPVISSEIEAAFPDRIRRDNTGRLVEIDGRFVTFEETRADRLQLRLFFRGSIGAGEAQGARGRGGRGAGAGRPQSAASGAPAPGGPTGPPSAAQREAFMQFRARICADDGLDVLTRLAQAAENGEDLSQTIPGFDAARFEQLLARVRGEDGQIDPERLARVRERICSFDPGSMGARVDDGGEGGPGNGSGSGGREGFAAFRAIACAEDGADRIKALIARIEAGEDVSDELPGFDPAMAERILARLRDEDGNIPDERISELRGRFCEADRGPGSGGQASGGPPPGFNPLARRSFKGFRYFVSLNHTIELENQILIASGLDPIDQLGGQGTGALGLPRHTSRLEAGIFGSGIGMRLSGRYTGTARLDGAGTGGTGDLFFDDLATFDIRLFSNIGELIGENEGVLQNFRVSLRVDNVFDARRSVRDGNGDTPLNYQPFRIDPVGRYVGIDLRKLF
ncbi:MAG: TonB-dependent receptor [Erythrobacter sp.]